MYGIDCVAPSGLGLCCGVTQPRFRETGLSSFAPLGQSINLSTDSLVNSFAPLEQSINFQSRQRGHRFCSPGAKYKF